MNLYNKLMRKKRGVSPIIAAILLIGLAVLAGAAIFVIVLPMLQSGTNASQVTIGWSGTGNASVSGTTYTFSVTVTNGGTAAINIKLSSVGYNNQSVPTFVSAGTITATVGSTDAVTNSVQVPVGQSVTVLITAKFPYVVKTGNLKVTFDAGSVGLVSNTFSNKVT